MSVTVGQRKRLRSGLFGRYFNTYFSDNMNNLSNPTNTDVQEALSSYSVGATDTWLFRGYSWQSTTSSSWKFRTNSDDVPMYGLVPTQSQLTRLWTPTTQLLIMVDYTVLKLENERTSNFDCWCLLPFCCCYWKQQRPGNTNSLSGKLMAAQRSSVGAGYLFCNPYAPNGFNLE